MNLYVIIATRGSEAVNLAVAENFPDEHYRLRNDVWFVHSDKTTRQVSQAIGIQDGSKGSGIVMPAINWSGRAPGDLWEWLNSRKESG